MFAWAGDQTQPGGFYRVRYTGKPVYLPVGLHAVKAGMTIRFSGALDPAAAGDARNYAVRTWSLKRSEQYGSKHYDEKSLPVRAARVSPDARAVTLEIDRLAPTWCMEIRYSLRGADGVSVEGVIHNTIHRLGVGDAPGKGVVGPLAAPAGGRPVDPPKPTSHTTRRIEGWTVRVDDRLLQAPNEAIGKRALRFLESKLADIAVVVPADRLKKLRAVTIVLDLMHGKLTSMQYHPSAAWLRAHGYSADLARCVHIPRAADLPTKRNINEQPWVILHELAHAYHDQVLGFNDLRVRAAYENYKKSGHGEQTLLYDGRRVRHYALTDEKEFFAEMTEAYFGVNDFFPFTRAELRESEPEIYSLLREIWETPRGPSTEVPASKQADRD
jgi:hypothetical protein